MKRLRAQRRGPTNGDARILLPVRRRRWRAYDAVRRGLSQLIQKEKIEEAKALALKLMQKGSFQVECSNEGLMQEEIENCLRLVISAVAESSGGSEWALEMLRHDRTGFVCRQQLTELAGANHGD